MLVATRLVELDLPEDKVLEKLNKVSTAKRQAYMVSKQRTGSYIEPNMPHRSYSTQSLGKGKRSTRQRQPESIASIIRIAPTGTDQISKFCVVEGGVEPTAW